MFGFSPLITRLIGYGIGALAIIAILFFAYRWAYSNGVASQQPLIQRLKDNNQTAVTANQQLLLKVQQLGAANKQLADSVTVNPAIAAAAVTSIQTDAQQAKADMANREHVITKIIQQQPSLAQCAAMKLPPQIVKELTQ